jgi:uncharacterized protein involved in exopolysaccharide biosynthesis
MEKQDEACQDEIKLLDLVRVLLKHTKFIIRFVFICVALTVVISLIMTNIYEAKAVIMPVSQQGSNAGGSGLSAIAQQISGGMGISMPPSSSGQEVVGLLKSYVLRETIITKYKLLPVLFYDQWNEKKQEWKKEIRIIDIPKKILGFFKGVFTSKPKGLPAREDGVPTVWDGLRLFDDIIIITDDLAKSNTITIAVDWEDPAIAAKIVEYFLTTLMDYMSAEAKRVAIVNQKSIEQEIIRTADPMIKQNLYTMIAQQIQTSMMAEAKENFAFKIIDPPKVPDLKYKPKRALMAIIAFIAALFLSVFIAFMKEYIEKNEEAKNIADDEGKKLKDMCRRFLKHRYVKKILSLTRITKDKDIVNPQ